MQSDDIDRSAASTASDGGSSNGSKLEGFRLRPGLAMSQDGRNWARIEAGHHTGALFDVGVPGEWDELFIGAPQVGEELNVTADGCSGIGAACPNKGEDKHGWVVLCGLLPAGNVYARMCACQWFLLRATH